MRSDVPSIEEAIIDLLDRSGVPLTSIEIATELATAVEVIDAAIWADPDRFVWQPGHRWAVSSQKRESLRPSGLAPAQDSRAAPLVPRESVGLKAITLSSGAKLRVSRRPLDTDALFTVRSVGADIQLILNSTHDVFDVLPMPFLESQENVDFQGLVELLLEAWALYEDGVSGTKGKVGVEESRLLWGRRMADLIHGSNAHG